MNRNAMQATGFQNRRAVPVLPPLKRIAGIEALTVPEILSTILGYASPPTLASAARVSRAWSSIALDRLWSENDISVIDLLQILPLCSPPAEFRYVMINWIMLRAPTNDEWDRFYSYASRIRSLSVSGPANGFKKCIADRKAENGVIFSRLRRIEWSLPPIVKLPPSPLRSFVTPSLEEFCLRREFAASEAEDEGQSVLDDLTMIEGVRLKKLKLEYRSTTPHINSKLEPAIASLVAASTDSIQAIELSPSDLNILCIAGHSLQNLRALSFRVPDISEAQPIQVLVKGCPHVTYLRLEIMRDVSSVKFLDVPGVSAILGWRLLSFEARLPARVRVGEAHIAQMAAAWPKLKQLHFNWPRSRIGTDLSLSRLAGIVDAFPELEDLGDLFHFNAAEVPFLPTYQPSATSYRPSGLQRLRLGRSSLYRGQGNQDSIAQFLARVCPPGLRIERAWPRVPNSNQALLAERKKIEMTGRDINPEWDDLFKKMEELQGGVRIWVGKIPEESDGVWF